MSFCLPAGRVYPRPCHIVTPDCYVYYKVNEAKKNPGIYIVTPDYYVYYKVNEAKKHPGIYIVTPDYYVYYKVNEAKKNSGIYIVTPDYYVYYKVNEAKKNPGIYIVTPDWLWACAERWSRVDESLFKLGIIHLFIFIDTSLGKGYYRYI